MPLVKSNWINEMKYLLTYYILIVVVVIGCTESDVHDLDKKKILSENLTFCIERTPENSINSQTISNFNFLEDLEIIYFDFENKFIYFRSAKDTSNIYYSNCVVDSAFFVNLTNYEHNDKVFVGSFYPTESQKVKLTFISVYSFDVINKKYQNSFNSFYFVDKSFIDLKIVYNLINHSNALFVSIYEGSGNFLEINLIARKMDKLNDITPEIPPLSQGEYIVDTGRVLLMEGLAAWELVSSENNENLELKKLDTIPIIDYRDGDKIIKYKSIGNRITTDSKIYVCNWTGVIHLQIDEPNNEFILNYDPQYFKRKFNQLIPQKTGYTYLELIDSDFNFVINNIKIIIN